MWPFNLSPMLVLAWTAFFSLLLVGGLRLACQRFGWLTDMPQGRKTHAAPTPSVGGLGFAIAFALALAASPLPMFDAYAPYLLAALVLLVMGVADDALDIGPLTKLLAQLGCVAAAVGWSASGYLTFGLPLHWLGAAGTALSFLGTLVLLAFYTNAFNMTDGIDGQAGLLSLTSLVFTAVAAHLLGVGQLVVLLALLAAAVAGFLFWNLRAPWRPRAVVFMGDAGSLLLGFSIAWATFFLSRQGMPETVMLWLMALPLFDATTVALGRLARGQNPMRADRTHLHHLLEQMGLSVPATVAVSSVAAALAAVTGIAMWVMQWSMLAQLALWLLAFVAYGALITLLRARVQNRTATATVPHSGLQA